jgi:ABC-type Mn2+/Zn2+ transport system permease subunit
MLLLAVAISVLATVSGIWLASWLHRETGPIIVTVAACGFLVSHLRR